MSKCEILGNTYRTVIWGDLSIFIIAEIGINHNGDINIAKELIKIAKDAGCDP
jgi:sialic acid synthase SpsE